MNELINAPTFFDKLSDFFSLCNPKPHSKNLVWDVFHIYILYFLSRVVMTYFFGSYCKIDVLTPWLIVGFITQPAYKSYVQLALVSLLLEYSSTLPAGFYLISYFSIATVIIESRAILSWRILTPWLASFLAAALWIFGSNFLIIYYFSGTDHLSIGFFIRGAINVLCCLILGMMWREDWKNFSPKE